MVAAKTLQADASAPEKSVQTVFSRHEKKYLLHSGQALSLQEAMAPFVHGDCYGLHTICSLYYDTPDFYFARMRGGERAFKEKLRVRSYGVPGPHDTVYMELKKKLCGVTYKRRVGVEYEWVERYNREGLFPPGEEQVLREIRQFNRQHAPGPKLVICYDRIALYGREERDLRITFDRNIRWRDEQLDLARGDWGRSLTGPGEVLMEIKTEHAFPCWLASLLSGAGVYPRSFSKYGSAYLATQQKGEHRIAG